MKLCLNVQSNNGNAFHMSEGKPEKMSREDRLAAKLRENLRRRKAQTRETKAEPADNGLPKGEDES